MTTYTCRICKNDFEETRVKNKNCCPSCREKIKKGEAKKPCERCGTEIVIKKVDKRYCERCQHLRRNEYQREYVRLARKGFYRVNETHTQNNACRGCQHEKECRRLVMTTAPIRCQVEDLTWPGGKNPMRPILALNYQGLSA